MTTLTIADTIARCYRDAGYLYCLQDGNAIEWHDTLTDAIAAAEEWYDFLREEEYGSHNFPAQDYSHCKNIDDLQRAINRTERMIAKSADREVYEIGLSLGVSFEPRR